MLLQTERPGRERLSRVRNVPSLPGTSLRFHSPSHQILSSPTVCRLWTLRKDNSGLSPVLLLPAGQSNCSVSKLYLTSLSRSETFGPPSLATSIMTTWLTFIEFSVCSRHYAKHLIQLKASTHHYTLRGAFCYSVHTGAQRARLSRSCSLLILVLPPVVPPTHYSSLIPTQSPFLTFFHSSNTAPEL